MNLLLFEGEFYCFYLYCKLLKTRLNFLEKSFHFLKLFLFA